MQSYLTEMTDMSLNTQMMMKENVREVEKLETISNQLKITHLSLNYNYYNMLYVYYL